MLPVKTTTPAGAAFPLAGNKPASPSVVPTFLLAGNKPASTSLLFAKQGQAGAAGGVVLAMDGKRTVTALAGRGDLSDADNDPKPKDFSPDLIKKLAEETSSLLRILRAPRDITFLERAAFFKEVDALKKTCDAIVEASDLDENGAVTILIGVQARMNLLVNFDNKESPQDLLIFSMGQIKAAVEDYKSAQDAQSAKLLASYNAQRKSLYEVVEQSSLVRPTPTICTEEEVKTVLEKTLALLDTEPVHSRRAMAGLFYKVRSECCALMEDVVKNGVNDKTGVAIELIHASAICVLGQHRKYFDYERGCTGRYPSGIASPP